MDAMSSFRPLLPYIGRHRFGFAASLVPVLLANVVWLLFPLVLLRAIDDIQAGSGQMLISDVLLLVAVAAGRGVFQFLARWTSVCVSRNIEFDLRNDFFRKLESLSAGFYGRSRTGDIMARATNDLNSVRTLVGPAVTYGAAAMVYTAGALVCMVRLSPRLAVWAFFPIPIASIAVQYCGGRIRERFERILAMFSQISSHAQENFSNARLIRAYGQEASEIRSFEGENREYIACSLRLARLMGMLGPTLNLLLAVAVVPVLWLGGREVLLGRMTVGTFVAFNAYLAQFTGPATSLGWVLNLVQSGRAAMGRINEVMAEKPEIEDDPAKACYGAETAIRGEIEFRDLSFTYGRERTVLNKVNLRVPAGSSLAILGLTGCGKSTLASLIARIHDAEARAVLIDGRPIREFRLEPLRRAIGFVPQETFLFSDTISSNIGFGSEGADAEDIRQAAAIAGIDEEIEAFPERYSTQVGERGLTLSGGQKQRIAIARAVIRDPRILVLDDALSSVDTETEELILGRLHAAMRGRTVILISHRVSTVRGADRIAVLHDGCIAEYGTHGELLARGGYYAGMYTRQLLEAELEIA
jgi:ATP-binding cassette subfamily B multidrug efflux pump